MTDDAELLRRYAEEHSEEAFAALVRRHLDMVYAVALRKVGGDAHFAEDVAQRVFADLATKAAALRRHPTLTGWLFTSTHFAATQLVRTESRWRIREQRAQTMNELLENSGPEIDWERLRPVLDDLIRELGERDREAVLLRFFEGRPLAEVGARIRLSEEGARSRVDRALGRMQAMLARRGITSTSAALAAALANQVGVAAPAGLAASVTGAALAGTTVGAGGWVATFMSISKLQLGIAGALAMAGATGYVMQGEANAGLRREIAALREQQQAVAALREENQQLAATAAEVELLRRDDLELKQLAQRVAEAKKANEENARLARTRGQQREAQVAQMREQDRLAQVEVQRMNKEGQKLVEEFKALNDQASDPSASPEVRANAKAAAQLKMAEIQAKQREVQAFIENTRRLLMQQFPEAAEAAGARREFRFAPTSSQPGASPSLEAVDTIVSLRLPQVDQAMALKTYEQFAGVKIVRDPSIANIHGTLTLEAGRGTKAETLQKLRTALSDQLNIVLEPTPDGNFIAKLGPPR